jgi:hypothetical protein
MNRFRPRLVAVTGVKFVHKQPSTPNLGDRLCTPGRYFTFQCERSTLIMGGGAYNGLGVKEARKFDAAIKVAWAIGQSWRLDAKAKPLDARAIGKTFTVATTRDPYFVIDESPLLPCVSVLHPIVDIPPGKEQGIFLNHDESASGVGIDGILRRYGERHLVATNSLSEAEFVQAFARVGDITTNSYHAAYWALLSGRSVTLVGYSTKFANLLALLHLDDGEVVGYRRGDSESLARAIRTAGNRAPMSLPDPGGLKARFREMNLSFAGSLGRHGIVATRNPTHEEPPQPL